MIQQPDNLLSGLLLSCCWALHIAGFQALSGVTTRSNPLQVRCCSFSNRGAISGDLLQTACWKTTELQATAVMEERRKRLSTDKEIQEMKGCSWCLAFEQLSSRGAALQASSPAGDFKARHQSGAFIRAAESH